MQRLNHSLFGLDIPSEYLMPVSGYHVVSDPNVLAKIFIRHHAASAHNVRTVYGIQTNLLRHRMTFAF